VLNVSGASVETGTKQLRAELRDGILRLTLVNEAKLNALTIEMLAAIGTVAQQIRHEDTVHVVLITGAGDRSFASGVDFTSLSSSGSDESRSDAHQVYRDALRAMGEIDCPIVAVIRGYCLGGGLALALSADIRLCDETASFAIPAAKIGLGYPDVRPLIETVGPGWAAEILFTGRALSSAEAAHAGLVNRVIDSVDLANQADALAASIASNAPLSVAAAKVALRESRKDPAERNQALVARMVEACAASDDFVEGRRAFAERRMPNFRGR
jgi:enoyl-CoA hydratase/carnithine racemase